jgi:hypothetical protein
MKAEDFTSTLDKIFRVERERLRTTQKFRVFE